MSSNKFLTFIKNIPIHFGMKLRISIITKICSILLQGVKQNVVGKCCKIGQGWINFLGVV